MAYWLYITNEKNWKVIRFENVFTVAGRHKDIIAKLKPGNEFLIYLKQRIEGEMKPSRVVAVYEAESEVFRESLKIFKPPKEIGNETFQFGIKLRAVKDFDKPVKFTFNPQAEVHHKRAEIVKTLDEQGDKRDSEEDFELILNVGCCE